MGNKANPRSLRLGISQDWDGSWYGGKDYAELLLQDFNIRSFLTSELERAGVARVVIKRKSGLLVANVYVSRTGIIFGRRGIDLNVLKAEISKQFGIKDKIDIRVFEVKNPEANARLLGEWVVSQLERRIPFRRAMKMAMQKALKAGAEGVKIMCSGRLGGAEIARSEGYREGKVPLHTLRADIDYAFSEALTTYGKIGVKVWINNGEKLMVTSEDEGQPVEEKKAAPAA